MPDKTIKLKIVQSLLEIVKDIADAEYQDRVWIKALEPLSDFDETMCHFFDDLNAKEIVDHPQEYDISPSQHKKLLELYNVLRAYSDDTPGFIEAEVMQDPRWHKIRILAKETLLVFNYPNANQIIT
ncbi:MAG: hypothetical protein JSR76_03105 [Verrucomicrobia bacterium]|nr:hypothetical protein [Verrucomicrobiota bacterium]